MDETNIKTNKKILYIDDDIRRATYTIKNLQNSGFSVLLLSDVDSVVESITSNLFSFNLIILDIMIPTQVYPVEQTYYGRKTGLVLYSIIRKKNKKVPILVHTANLEINKDDFPNDDLLAIVHKPTFYNTLLGAINTLLKVEK